MSNPKHDLIPSLCYDDAPAAIAWLERAFGFTAHLVVPGDEGKVMHSQLKSPDGNSMVMVFSTRDGEGEQRTPMSLGGNHQALYLVVDDVNAHHERALAAGATVSMPPTDQHYGGSCYACSDPEGHVWNFGSYDPWAPA